jgi:hypothetical protein
MLRVVIIILIYHRHRSADLNQHNSGGTKEIIRIRSLCRLCLSRNSNRAHPEYEETAYICHSLLSFSVSIEFLFPLIIKKLLP